MIGKSLTIILFWKSYRNKLPIHLQFHWKSQLMQHVEESCSDTSYSSAINNIVYTRVNNIVNKPCWQGAAQQCYNLKTLKSRLKIDRALRVELETKYGKIAPQAPKLKPISYTQRLACCYRLWARDCNYCKTWSLQSLCVNFRNLWQQLLNYWTRKYCQILLKKYCACNSLFNCFMRTNLIR